MYVETFFRNFLLGMVSGRGPPQWLSRFHHEIYFITYHTASKASVFTASVTIERNISTRFCSSGVVREQYANTSVATSVAPYKAI